jgi:6-pyruvoyltetrahydropterin/6-carboxytetrahydropterin synthase
MKIKRRLEWDAAHRVLRHESKCATLHGHRYIALVTCSAPELDACGRVIDFGVVKEVVGLWIDDNWDHTTLVNRDDHDLIEEGVVDESQDLPAEAVAEPGQRHR